MCKEKNEMQLKHVALSAYTSTTKMSIKLTVNFWKKRVKSYLHSHGEVKCQRNQILLISTRWMKNKKLKVACQPFPCRSVTFDICRQICSFFMTVTGRAKCSWSSIVMFIKSSAVFEQNLGVYPTILWNKSINKKHNRSNSVPMQLVSRSLKEEYGKRLRWAHV